jgi:hypothetical protein
MRSNTHPAKARIESGRFSGNHQFMVSRNTPSVWFVIVSHYLAAIVTAVAQHPPPYPPSQIITGMTWHWDTYQTAALGSDLWPVTWGPDDSLYVAWGDGGGFGGGDHDGRVSMGFGRIEGGPEHFRGININGGKNPENPASFPKKGKTAALFYCNGILYTSINLQDGKWPYVNHAIAWSADKGATWTRCDWLFPTGEGNFQPARFINFGKDGGGIPHGLKGYAYLIGGKQQGKGTNINIYLARVPDDKIREHGAYEFFGGADASGQPAWNADLANARPIFVDANGTDVGGMNYDPGLGCFLLTCFHTGPGELGIFEAKNPWGPWSTVAYYSDWGGMGSTGDALTCEFPQKWMSADGMTLWAIFSVWGESAKHGINAHDRFNLIKVTLSNAPRPKTDHAPDPAR